MIHQLAVKREVHSISLVIITVFCPVTEHYMTHQNRPRTLAIHDTPTHHVTNSNK